MPRHLDHSPSHELAMALSRVVGLTNPIASGAVRTQLPADNRSSLSTDESFKDWVATHFGMCGEGTAVVEPEISGPPYA